MKALTVLNLNSKYLGINAFESLRLLRFMHKKDQAFTISMKETKYIIIFPQQLFGTR